MLTARQCIACVLTVLLALPAWSDSNAVGSIVSGSSAALRNEPLASGSTVFSGDAVSVGKNGSAQIALTGGARIEVSSDSTIRLTRNQAAVDLSVGRGTATFVDEPNGALEVVVGDATIRPFQGQPAEGPVSGIIHIERLDSAVVIAQKGSLQIVTGHTSGATTVQQGQAARITLVSDLPAGAPAAARPADAVPVGNLTAIKTFAIVALIVGPPVAAIVLSLKEPKQSDQKLENEASPFKLNSK